MTVDKATDNTVIIENIKAEQQLIGSALNDSGSVSKVPHIEPSHFSLKLHQTVWDIIASMPQANTVALSAELKHRKVKVDVDGYKGLKYFEYCQSLATSGLHIESHASDVFKAWIGRRTMAKFKKAQDEIQKMALSSYSYSEFEATINELFASIYKDGKVVHRKGLRSAEEIVIEGLLPRYERRRNGTEVKISTGLTALDEYMYGGFTDGSGDVMQIGGDSGSGKSELALVICKSVLAQGRTVFVFSMESDDWQFLQRIIQMTHDIGLKEFALPQTLDEDSYKDIHTKISETRPRLYVDDTPKVTPQHVLMQTKLMINLGIKPDLIIIDYVGLQGVSNKDRVVARGGNEKSSYLHGYIKSIARMLCVNIVSLEQHKKEVKNEVPTISSIMFNAVNDADLSLSVFRGDKQAPHLFAQKPNIVQLYIHKNRQFVKLGMAEVFREPKTGNYIDWNPPPKIQLN